MVLVDEGNGKDLEFGHTDYRTGEGRPVTRSENRKEKYVNPELSYEERHRISIRDNKRRNEYQIHLLSENNTRIIESVHYNPFTEALSVGWRVQGNNGKRLLDITDSLNNRSKNLRSGLEVRRVIYTPFPILLSEEKHKMKKEEKEGEKGGAELTVKLSGYTLEQLISVRGKREKSTGRITSIAELVREAIDCWADTEAGETE